MIADNLQQLKVKISNACRSAGKNPDDVKLVAVSKYFGIKAITEAANLGITDFGENKAQELRDKYNILGDKVTWHFIGTLQRNKVKYVVNCSSLIHSVDSKPLVDEINNQAEKNNKIQKILLEVKTSGEESKSGLEMEEQVIELAEYCGTLKNVRLIGLMTMAPFTDDEGLIRKSFSGLRKLKDKLNQQGYKLTELSMGMTSDFEIAISEGSTIVRIGSAIFGQRDYSKDWRNL
jgi:pyridoxal phosphate enzyme (YggS family)